MVGRSQVNKKQYMPAEGELSDPEELMQTRPLLGDALQPTSTTSNGNNLPKGSKLSRKTPASGPFGKVKTFNEDEESTKILQLVYLQYSYFKAIVVVPLLSICTAFFFLLFLYWYPNLRKKFFYSECTGSVTEATHLFVVGTSK